MKIKAGRLSGPLQLAEKGPIASLLQKVQILTYRKYASALNFFCAYHSNLSQQPARVDFVNSLKQAGYPVRFLFDSFEKNGLRAFFICAYKGNTSLADKIYMIIQASHMNQSFMQKLQAHKNQGENLGSANGLLDNSPGLRLGTSLNINPAKIGLTPAAEALARAPGQQGKLPERAPESLGATFANEIIRRMGEELDAEGQPKDVSALRHSLGSTMDWLRERFGDETAAAAVGMILQSTSSGVTEESLGDGLLNTLKFIDRNFGFAAGDAAIATLNSGINSELNNYFDNGKSEIFFASDSVPDVSTPSATQDINVRFFLRTIQADTADDKRETDLTADILKSLRVELDKIAELQDLSTRLEANFNSPKSTPEAAATAYESQPFFAGPQFTDMAV